MKQSLAFQWLRLTGANQLRVRHIKCVGGADGPLCGLCSSIGCSKQLVAEISCWSCRIRLASYAHTLCLATPSDQLAAASALRDADFYRLGNGKCKQEIDRVLAIESKIHQIEVIKKKLLSIPIRHRSPKLHAWLEARVMTLEVPTEPESERAAMLALTKAFSSSVLSGDKEVAADLRIAAKVASGGLRASRVVNCLLQSFFEMRDSRFNRHAPGIARPPLACS